MLTLHAFNALLKTLEEPPAHVKFMFATTETHKVPVTILSRCQRFDFKKIPLAQVVEHLEHAFKALKERKIKLLIVSSENEIGNIYLKEILGSEFVAMEAAGLIRSESLTTESLNS